MTVVLAGCIGAVDRSEFDAEVRARGGGVTSTWIVESFDAVARSVGGTSASELQTLSFNVNTTNRTATVVTRRVDRPEFVDTVVVRQGDVVSTAALQDADSLPLDDLSVPFAALPMDQIEELSDRSLSEFGEPDGFVAAIRLDSIGGGHQIIVKLESARFTADVTFSTDGTFIGIER